MGKTTLALAAAHDPRVVARFGRRGAFFVNLDPVAGRRRRLAPACDRPRPRRRPARRRNSRRTSPPLAPPSRRSRSSTISRRLGARTGRRPRRLLGGSRRSTGLRLVVTVRGEPPNIPGPGARTLRGRRTARRRRRARSVPAPCRRPVRGRPRPARPRQRARRPSAVDRASCRQRRRQTRSEGRPRRLEGPPRRFACGRRGRRPPDEPAAPRSGFRSTPSVRRAPPHRLIRAMAMLPDGMSDADSRTILSDGEPTGRARRGGPPRRRPASRAAPTAAGGCSRRSARRCSPTFRRRRKTATRLISRFLAPRGGRRESTLGRPNGRGEATELLAEAAISTP